MTEISAKSVSDVHEIIQNYEIENNSKFTVVKKDANYGNDEKEYMKHLTTDTWDTLIEKSRNSSGLCCTLDGRRGTTCLEEAIEKQPSVDEREYLEVIKHAVSKQINPFHLVGLLHEVTSRLVKEEYVTLGIDPSDTDRRCKEAFEAFRADK